MESITLADLQDPRLNIAQPHIDAFKAMLLKRVSNKNNINSINNITLHNIRNLATRPYATQVYFYLDGRCRFIPHYDEVSEINLIRKDIYTNGVA